MGCQFCFVLFFLFPYILTPILFSYVLIFISEEWWKLSAVEDLMQGQMYRVRGFSAKEVEFDTHSTIRN